MISCSTKKTKNISIIWDFDKTLTPQDSTTELIRLLLKDKDKNSQNTNNFWKEVKKISGVKQKSDPRSISTCETPAWMYMLAEIANGLGKPLDKNNMISKFASQIKLYKGVLFFLKTTKDFSNKEIYKNNNIKVNHFIITAGLQDLVSSVFEYHKEAKLIEEIFGCKYRVRSTQDKEKPYVNIPIYCMDKTTKTRSLFEIHKGCFLSTISVDDLISEEETWCPFENMIYIGDGDTDIPAFALIKKRRGMAIGVYNPEEEKSTVQDKIKNLIKGKRLDLLTKANFSTKETLFKAIENQCYRIVQRYEAQKTLS